MTGSIRRAIATTSWSGPGSSMLKLPEQPFGHELERLCLGARLERGFERQQQRAWRSRRPYRLHCPLSNSGVSAVVNGVPLGEASGIAPRARVAAYKVCWTYNDSTATDGTNAKNSCFTSDSIGAIDAAVRDGVNVINYSISGGATSGDAVEQAFFRAVQANVFVAASAKQCGAGQHGGAREPVGDHGRRVDP
ncbi:hypothetical protein LP419_05080 [Massilia sp. H-1]|nr:hypothetical protein LP419_05080 [Massilia sp. H-1]